MADDASLAAQAMRFAETRGLEIYQRDTVAWVATDAALANGLAKTNAVGWVTLPSQDDWHVRFVADCDGTPCSVLDVAVSEVGTDANLVSPPEPLTQSQLRAWQARQRALHSEYGRCSENYNTVVIPPEDENGTWTVYLLAASKDAGEMLLGGHHRVSVSWDGTQIVKSQPLSKSCLTLKKEPNAAAMFVTHVLDAYPIETHVFTSLTHKMQLYVGTEEGRFLVDGASISTKD